MFLMLYCAPQSTLKDNYVVWHSGTYYMYAMFQEPNRAGHNS